jgi:protein-tyrosine-phosphatase
MPQVLFACTQSSDRSLMAAGLLRQLGTPAWGSTAAGERAAGPTPLAVVVMEEAGVSLHGDRAVPFDEANARRWDVAISLCDPAMET